MHTKFLFSSNLETLPNELFFLIFSYMIQADIVHAFFGLNCRFNSIVMECIRHFKISEKTPADWFVKYMPWIQNAIEIISLNINSVPYVFSCTYSYQNLRSVILKNRYNATIKLNIENYAVLDAVVSCLDLLRICGAWKMNNF